MMLGLLVLIGLLLFLATYPILPISMSGVVTFGISAVLAPLIYYQDPQKVVELLGISIKPLKQYLRQLNPCRLIIYCALAVGSYSLLLWINLKIVEIWPNRIGGTWLREWSDKSEMIQMALLQGSNLGWLFLVVGVLTPIAEELFFRGVIMGWMSQRRFPQWSVILFPAILFTAMHLNPGGSLPILFLSLILGYLRYVSNSLLLPIGLHICNNILTICLYGIA